MRNRPAIVPHESVMLVGVALCAAYMSATGIGQQVVLTIASVFPAAIITHQLFTHQGRYGTPWRFLGVAAVLLSGRAVTRLVQALVDGEVTRAGPLSQTILLAGYVVMLVGALLLLAPHARPGKGIISEAAVGWFAGAGILWSTLLGPALHEQGADSPQRFATFLVVLVLSGVTGMLIQAAIVTPAARGTMLLLALAAALTLGSRVLDRLTDQPAYAPSVTAVGLLAVLGYSVLAAAILHPDHATRAPVHPQAPERVTAVRLSVLGLALMVNPLVAAQHALTGQRVDGAVLLCTTLAITPLVVRRMAQLVRTRYAAEAALRHQADHCETTGLPNRRRGLEVLEASLAQTAAETDSDRPGSLLLFVDVNDLKTINDTHGHLAGDAVVRAVARTLTAAVGAAGTVARVGGDEFLVVARAGIVAADRLLTTVTNAVQSVTVTHEVPQAQTEPGREPERRTLLASAAVGAHRVAPGTRTTASAVIASADARMYAAKPTRST